MDWKERLREETLELAKKTNKLNDFMRTKVFYNLSRKMKTIMYKQYHAMLDYLQALGERCEYWEIDLGIGDDENV